MTCLQHLHYVGAAPFDCPACTAIERAAEAEKEIVFGLPLIEVASYLDEAEDRDRFWEIIERLDFGVLVDYSKSAEDAVWLHSLADRISERRVLAQARREAAA